jgi:hypothetical protein
MERLDRRELAEDSMELLDGRELDKRELDGTEDSIIVLLEGREVARLDKRVQAEDCWTGEKRR